MGDRPAIDSQAVRVHVVLRSAQGLTVAEIHAGLRARGYVSEPQDVVDALARHPDEFRSERHDGVTRWSVTHSVFPTNLGTPGPRGAATRRDPSQRDETRDDSWESSWEWATDETSERLTPGTIVARINEARRRRGEAVLDTREAAQVAANLERRAADPNRYRSVCWSCKAVVDQGTNLNCDECRWLICWCGACRKRTYVDQRGVSGACRREVWTLQDYDLPDLDFRGRRIVTAKNPDADANSLRRLSHTAGIASLFHWSPARAIPDILRWGFLARPALRDRGIPFVPHGYGSLEKEQALSAYVATSMRPKVLMMRAWSDEPVTWELDPEILEAAGTLFVDGNSASADRSLDQVRASTGLAAFERALKALDTPGGQPEVLIPNRIPRAAITRIHVSDEAIAQQTQRAVEGVGARLAWDLCWSEDCPVGPFA